MAVDDLRRTHRTAVIIAVAMLGSLAVYIVVVEILRYTRSFRGVGDLSELDALRYAFFLAAMASLVLARTVRSSFVARQPGRPLLTPQRLLTGTVLSLAYCEVSAVLGLLLFLLQGRVFSFYVFMSVSLVAMLLFFPRYAQWEEWMGGARAPAD
jgi:hypothetical protein